MIKLRGLSISIGIAQGTLLLEEENVKMPPTQDLVLLLKNLKIETVMRALQTKKLVAVLALDGGITAHGGAILREQKLPCVSQLPGKIRKYRGRLVHVDAFLGEVYVDDN